MRDSFLKGHNITTKRPLNEVKDTMNSTEPLTMNP